MAGATSIPHAIIFEDRYYRAGEQIQGEVYLGYPPDVTSRMKIDMALVGVSVASIRHPRDWLLIHDSSSRLVFRHARLSSSSSSTFPFSFTLPGTGDEELAEVRGSDEAFAPPGEDELLPPTMLVDHDAEQGDIFALSVCYALVVKAPGVGVFQHAFRYLQGLTLPADVNVNTWPLSRKVSLQTHDLLPEESRPKGAAGLFKSALKIQAPRVDFDLILKVPMHLYIGNVVEYGIKAQVSVSDPSVAPPPISIDYITSTLGGKTSVRTPDTTTGRYERPPGPYGAPLRNIMLAKMTKACFKDEQCGPRATPPRIPGNVDLPMLSEENGYEGTIFTRAVPNGTVPPSFSTLNSERSYTLEIVVGVTCAGKAFSHEQSAQVEVHTPVADGAEPAASTSVQPSDWNAVFMPLPATTAQNPSHRSIDRRPAPTLPPEYTSEPNSPEAERENPLAEMPSGWSADMPADIRLGSKAEFFNVVMDAALPRTDAWRHPPRIVRQAIRNDIAKHVETVADRVSRHKSSSSTTGASAGAFIGATAGGGGGGGGG